ncbi:Aste57867_19875 [Aphanomyces stellatus]|uniref:Aste57867_19875 protein n=1 Tax=Aphanomyces stellatus TaxID=120398 RepID=A0A485LI96_9STRA|nr:hypothetical protein As57867_019809 [Aphanomyces stellatus]VFT96573.1 Aste57867_19875 [Aphanomyces stellatus]
MDAIGRVLSTRDLLWAITTYQSGLREDLLPTWGLAYPLRISFARGNVDVYLPEWLTRFGTGRLPALIECFPAMKVPVIGFAIQLGRVDVLDAMRRHGYIQHSYDKLLVQAATCDQVTVVHYLYGIGYAGNVKEAVRSARKVFAHVDTIFASCMVEAISKCHVPLMTLLIDSCRMDKMVVQSLVRHPRGEQALHVAIQRRDIDAIELLESLGASVAWSTLLHDLVWYRPFFLYLVQPAPFAGRWFSPDIHGRSWGDTTIARTDTMA